jgi:phage shock protein A
VTESQTTAPETGTATATAAPKFDTSDASSEMAAFLAEIGETKPADAAPAEAAPAEEAAPVEGGETPAEATEGEEVEAAPADGATDETVSKQLNAIRRARQREEAAIAKQRAALDAKAAEVQQLAAKYGEFEPQVKAFHAAKAQARRDPASVLLSLGYKPAELAEAAKLVFYASPDATESMRAEAQQYQRTREVDETTAQLAAEVRELKQQIATREQQATAQQAVRQFFAGVDEAAASAPLVSKYAKAEPDEFRADVERIAISLHQTTGTTPTPAAVVDAYETRLRARLKALGVDADTAAPKTKNQNGREIKPARTLGNDLSTTTRPRPASSTPEEDLAAFLADAEAGRLG